MIALSNHPKIQELSTSESPTNKLYFKHASSFYAYLHQLVKETLSENKSVLLTVNSDKDVQDLHRELQAFQQFMYLYDSHEISLQSISKLRVRYKRKVSYLNYLEFENLKTKQDKILDNISASYASCYNHENHFSLNKLLQSQRSDITNIHVPILEHYIPPHLFDGSKTELNYLTEIINWAAESYDHNFRAFTECSWFGSYQAQEFTENSFVELRQQLDKANELVILFLNNLNQYKESDTSYKEDACQTAKELLIQLNGIHRKVTKVDELLFHSDGNLLSKLSSKIKSNNNRSLYSENIEIEFDHWVKRFKQSIPTLFQQYSMLEESTLVPNLLTAKQLLNDHLIQLQQQDKKVNGTYIEQLNVHNCPAIFKNIISELNSFYHDVSSSGLVHMPVSDNSFNIINNYEYLLRVRNKINDIVTLEQQQPQYFKWIKRFEQCSNLEKIVLNTLISFFPDKHSWVGVFCDYYHFALSKTLLLKPAKLSNSMTRLEEVSSKLTELNAENIEYKTQEKLIDVCTQLKKSDLDTYKTLFKKKYDPSQLNLTTPELFKLIQSLFPITIVAKDKWKDLGQVQQLWDMHIHVDSSKFETDEHEFQDIANSYTYIKHPIDEFKLRQHLKEENSYVLNFDCTEFIKHPKLRTDSDQLNFSRSLSSKLEDYLHRIQIFQLENQYVISFMDKSLILSFLEIHKQYTIKKFVLDHDLNYSLSDILLVGTDNITVMIQDHLLDPNDYHSLQWQRYLISLMSRAGMNIKDVSMSSIFDKDYSDLFIPITSINTEVDIAEDVALPVTTNA